MDRLVTGGRGFTGSNFLRPREGPATAPARLINLDALTYAADPDPPADPPANTSRGRHHFVQGGIRSPFRQTLTPTPS